MIKKRFFRLISCFVIMTLIMPVFSIDRVSAAMIEDIIKEFNFSDYSVAGLASPDNAKTAPTGWVANNVTGYSSGGRILPGNDAGNIHMAVYSGSGTSYSEPNVTHTLASVLRATDSLDGHFYMRMRIKFTNTSTERRIDVRASGKAYDNSTIFFKADGTIFAYDGTTTAVDTGCAYAANTWYTLKVDYNLNWANLTGTSGTHYSATLTPEGGDETTLFTDYRTRNNALDTIAQLRFEQMGPDATSGGMLIDDIQIYKFIDEDAPAVVTAAITSPANNSVFKKGRDIDFTVNTTIDKDGTVAKVEYFNKGDLIGDTTTPPFDFKWINPPVGVHTITASAYSADYETKPEEVGVSAPITVIVKDVEIPSIFGNDMILQQGEDINVWGTGVDGDVITVILENDGNQLDTVQQSDVIAEGNWSVTLPNTRAADNITTYTMKIESNNGFEREITGIMMGEVWVCGGQSNMEWKLSADEDYKGGNGGNTEFPKIRLFSQNANPISSPADDVREDSRGWEVCTENTAKNFSAVGFYFGREIHVDQNVPVGLIYAAVGGTAMSTWLSKEALSSKTELLGYKGSTVNWTDQNLQNGQYNGMIAPIIPFRTKGVIWYQGETDAYAGYVYKTLLTTLIESWRAAWGNDDMAFHIVQLPNQDDDRGASYKWELIRDSQLKVSQELNNVGLAVAIDLGYDENGEQASKLHPKYKKQVGHRLALSALKLTYSEDIDPYQGPIYKSVKLDGNKIIVDFDHKGEGLKTSDDEVPAEFEICDTSGTYYPATAAIVDDKIELTSLDVEVPMGARYAWKNRPYVNLYNSEDSNVVLPASPFSSMITAMADAVDEDENEAPTVTFDDVTMNTAVIPGSDINVTITAGDSDGYVNNIKLYQGTSFVGSVDNSSSVNFTLSNVTSTTNKIVAIATDNDGAVAVSDIVEIKIANKVDANVYKANANFDDYEDTDGATIPNELTVSGAGIWPTSNVKVYSAVSPNPEYAGDRCMYFETLSTSADANLTQLFSPYSSSFVTLEADLYFEGVARRWIELRSGNPTGTNTAILDFYSDGKILSSGTITNEDLVRNYSADKTKYSVKAMFSPSTKIYEIYLNGDLVKKGTIRSPGAFDTVAGFAIKQNGTNAKIYIDNFKQYTTVQGAEIDSVTVAGTTGLGAPVDGNITINFNETMDIDTLNKNNIKLLDKNGNEVDYGVGAATATSYQIPYTGLNSREIYRVVVGTGVKTGTGLAYSKELAYSVMVLDNDISVVVNGYGTIGNKTASCTVTVYNNSNKPTDVVLAVGIYKGSKLLAFNAEEFGDSVTEGSSAQLSCNAVLDEFEDGITAKAFVWENIDGLNYLTDAIPVN